MISFALPHNPGYGCGDGNSDPENGDTENTVFIKPIKAISSTPIFI